MSSRTLADLRPYLTRHKDVGSPAVADYTVAGTYAIRYKGQLVMGVTGDSISFYDAYGSHESLPLTDVDWDRIQVYKLMNIW